MRKLKPEFFAEDFKFIGYLGETEHFPEAKANAADFREANAARPSFYRTGLRIRVSGMKATKLAHQLFSNGNPTTLFLNFAREHFTLGYPGRWKELRTSISNQITVLLRRGFTYLG